MNQVNTCVNCLEDAEHLHHVVPKVWGGTDNPGNLVWLCTSCHSIAHDFKKMSDREMQRKGIAKAKAEGKYKGRKPTAIAKADKVKQLHQEGMKANQIAETVGISRASVYRCLKNYDDIKPNCPYPGRKPSYTYEQCLDILEELKTKNISQLSKDHGLSRQAVIRIRDNLEDCLDSLKKWNLT